VVGKVPLLGVVIGIEHGDYDMIHMA
jgi:hypothetical protein